MKKKKSDRKNTSFTKALITGTLAGLAVWIVLLIGTSFFIAGFDEPESFILPAVFLLAAVSAFISGSVSGKITGGMLSGITSGAALMIVVMAISVICAEKGSSVSMTLRLAVCAVFGVFAVVGAYFSARPKKQKRRTVSARR